MTLAGEAYLAMRSLPVGDFDDILKGQQALILAPHQDDETIGCGGLIAQASSRGRPPIVVFVTDGSGSHPLSRRYPKPSLSELRQREARNAASVLGLGADRLRFLALPDTACPDAGPGFDAAVTTILDLIAALPGCVIIAPWRYDQHCDHVAVHKMAVSAAAISGARHLSYPVWGWTLDPRHNLGAVPLTGWRLDVGRLRGLKLRALAEHASQTTDLIDDDPTGFRLTPTMVATIMPDHETYLDNP